MAFSQADLNAIAAAQAAHPNLPPNYLLGIAQLETGGSANPDTAASGTGPVGLFQIAPSTYQSPGFGLPTQNVTTSQAISALQDPTTSANFAADYLDALQNSKGLPGATSFYSGGGYGESQVTAAETAALTNNPGYQSQTGGNVSTTTGTGTGAIDPNSGLPADPAASAAQANPGLAQNLNPFGLAGWASYLLELATRGGVFALGGALVLVALIALLWESKTVEVPTRYLREG